MNATKIAVDEINPPAVSTVIRLSSDLKMTCMTLKRLLMHIYP